MGLKFTSKSQYQVMPWKNGQGMTAQIQMFPEGASFPDGDFLWRLSSATVQASGPFSLFPGCDRILVVLSGEGLLLNSARLEPLNPIRFSGEFVIDCQLIGGEVVDLGLIFRRDKVQADVSIETLPAGAQTLSLNSKTHLLYLYSGSCEVQGRRVEAGDTLQVTGEKEIALRVLSSEGAKLIHFQVAD
ncbi:HutD family protein [Bdellovibrio sp. HCB337]|uniref:HutD/Ves family protein n=1 Tax=Bdellovibrio sp. HCB337 TaxID=3394358 RepID=UPI0039A66761